MSNTPSLVDKISGLAKLNVPKTDKDAMEESLNNIFQLLNKMKNIDTSNIDPLAHPLDIQLSPRQDYVSERDQRPLMQSACATTKECFYTVPPVINRNQEDD